MWASRSCSRAAASSSCSTSCSSPNGRTAARAARGRPTKISDGRLRHLADGDTTFAAVSLAPIEKIEAYKARRGWSFAWYSSAGSSFNRDFQVTVDDDQPLYNYREDALAPGEYPGYSVFLRDGDRVFHSYSSYARGTETIGGAHYILDLTPLGRAD
jgi:predicted dithiol-disulfide oxidoreductase (DUF899 family)